MMSRCRLLVPAIGLGAGAATSFLGIGGGAIIVPLLMIAVGLPFKEAVGTSLAAVLVISTVGVISTLAVDASNVAWMVAAVLTAGTLTGSFDRWPRAGARGRAPAPSRLRAALLVLTGWRLVTTPAAGASGALTLGLTPTPIHAVVFVIGVAAGVTSVLFGLGGGVVIVPALLMAFPEAPFRMVAATSLLTVIPTSVLSIVPGLPNLAAVAARLHALPGDALCQIHRLAAVSIARLPTSRPQRNAEATSLMK